MLKNTSKRYLDRRQVSRAKKTFRLQEETKDCGSACLVSISRYFGTSYTIAEINELSGTNSNGTTVLGLYTASNELGIYSEALRAKSITNLIEETENPSILHVVMNQSLYHYIVFYGKTQYDKNLIGDPAKGVYEICDSELEKIWQSKILLIFKAPPLVKNSKSTHTKKKSIILDLLKSQNKILIISIFLGLVISIISLSTAIFYQYFIDKILPSKDSQKLMLALFCLTFLLIFNSGITFVREIIIYRQSKALSIKIFDTFFSNLLPLSKSFFDNKKIGEFTSRLLDIRQIDVFLTQTIGNALINLLIIIVFTTVIFTKSAGASYMLIISIALTFFITKYFISKILPLQKDILLLYGNTESLFYDIIKGIDAIKAFSKERTYLNMICSTYSKFQGCTFETNKTESTFNLCMSLIMILTSMGIIFLTSSQVLYNKLSLGEMLAITFLSSTVINSATTFIPIGMLFKRVNVSINRIFDHILLNSESEAAGESIRLDVLKLEVKNLNFGFRGCSNILKDINLHFSKGEIILIKGDIGTGKSLLFSTIIKLYDKISGEVTIFNSGSKMISWREVSKQNWRKLFSIVPQEIALFNGTILENITLDKIEDDKTYGNAIEIYNIVMKPCLNNLPDGPLTLVGQGGIKLSVGQIKLLGLARALFKKSPILLLDEITAGMDKDTEKHSINILNNISSNFLIAIISHNEDSNLHFNRKYVLNEGKLELLK